MKYTVSQAAKLLDVSRQTIYKKLDVLDLQQHIIVENDNRYITDKGLELIKKSICKPIDVNSDSQVDVNVDVNLHDNLTSINNAYIDSLKSEIDYLRQQLTNKDKLLENMQVLLKGEQESRKLLEEKIDNEVALTEEPIPSFKKELQEFESRIEESLKIRYSELDEKIIQWREQSYLQERHPKSFFQRLFGK